jgi:hypothetical protein
VKYKTIIFLILILIIRTTLGRSQVEFERRTIDSNYSAFFITNYDLDKDGDQDVISGRLELAWWENDGSGNFTKHYLGNFTRLFSIFPVDIDKDGDIDLLTADIEETTIRCYENDGNEDFEMTHLISDVNRAESVAAADFDKDGDLDICVVTTETKQVFWCEHRGNMNFDTRHILASDFDRGHKIAVADINDDGWMDIIAVGSIGFRWWENEGDEEFKQRIIGTGGLGFKVVDIDKNGTLDIVFCRHGDDGYVLLYLNNGAGIFSMKVLSSGENWPTWVTVGDLNNDDELDFVLVNGGRRTGPYGGLVYFENVGGNNFNRYPVDNSVLNVPFMAEIADFDRDGVLDIVSGHESYYLDDGYYKGNLYWWENTFVPVVETITAPSSLSGPVIGKTGELLEFKVSGSESNFGHSLEYQFDWGDGQQSEWGPDSANNSFTSQGNFDIKARARCQEHTDIVSNWSDSLQVTISPHEYNVSGHALYYSNDQPIENVLLNISDDITETKSTNVEGLYRITVEAGNNIFVTPGKPKGEEVSLFDITTYDAALTAQYAIGLIQLDNYQQEAADADKNGFIQTYDAALIAQHAVGLPPAAPSSVSEWRFQPKNKNLGGINSDLTEENFSGIIVGNVHGGWSQSELNIRKKLKAANVHRIVKILKKNNNIYIPFYVEKKQQVIAADIELIFNSNVVNFIKYEKSNLSKNFQVFQNLETDKLRIALYSVNPIDNSGELLRLIFSKTEDSYQEEPIRITKLILNDEVLINLTSAVSLNITKSGLNKFKLHQNYPNPFNSFTTIKYDVLKDGFGEIKIFNIDGQEIRTLVKGSISRGNHEITWNGKDDYGITVVSGVYFCQLKVNQLRSISKLLMIE